jgi:hypothetical protein
MKERGNYETMRKATHLYIKEIRSLLRPAHYEHS